MDRSSAPAATTD